MSTETKGLVFLNVLLNRYHQTDASTILNVLPQVTAEGLKQTATKSSDAVAAIRMPETLLSGMHFSWMVPALSQSPEPLRSLLIGCLSEKQRQGVCRQLHLSVPQNKSSKVAKAYLTRHLALQLGVTECLPLAYLQETPLKPLASLSKDEFILLIDYLGLRDLAEALRPIIDKRILEALHRCLTAPERHLLRIYLHQRDPLKTSKLDIAKWDGKRDSLRLMYHQRGLARLAKALSGQPPQLLWHISRCLDQKRAQLLESMGVAKEPTPVTPTLILQIVAILDFLQRKSGE